MVQTDVLQCSFSSGSDFDPCYLLEKRIWPSENKGDPGYPDPVRMRGSDPAFALPSADDRFWHESWNTGSVSIIQMRTGTALQEDIITFTLPEGAMN